jgi:hypothetical protein
MKMAIMQAAVTARRRAVNSTVWGGEIADKADSTEVLRYTAPVMEPTMSEPASLIMVQFLTWVADRPRTYPETLDAWHSTCPRLSVWEDAIIDGLVRIENGGCRAVALTPRGRVLLEKSTVS